MTAADREAFGALMIGIGEAYGEAVSAARIELYLRALWDLPLDSISAAANAHVRGSKFFPRPSELRELAEGSTEDNAELAWVELVRLVRSVGYYGKPEWPDEAMKRAALELYGGWYALCERLPAEGPGFFAAAKQFKALYAGYARRAQVAQLEAGQAVAMLTEGGR